MHFSPRDIDKLLLHNAGFLAQKRSRARVRLNYPESVALIADADSGIHPRRAIGGGADGSRPAISRQAAGHERRAGDGREVQVEGTFPDGTKLVTVHHPIAAENGDLELALYGSFLPVPPLSVFKTSDESQAMPGACEAGRRRDRAECRTR